MTNDAPAAPLPLEIRDLKVTARRGRALLSVDALTVAPGELVGIRGPSGAGKSTFLNAISGLADTASGQIRWGGTDLLSLTREARARFRLRHLGMIFQDLLLFDELSAQGNGAIAAMFAPAAERPAIRAAAGEALARLNLPTGPRAVASFSGGERQRVAVARALAGAPAVLLADEPTASLDRASADALIADLTGLCRARGGTLIAVSHDAHLLAAMDRVLEIADGTLLPETVLPHA